MPRKPDYVKSFTGVGESKQPQTLNRIHEQIKMPRKPDYVKSFTGVGKSKQKVQLRMMQSHDSVAASPSSRNSTHQSTPSVPKTRFKEEFNSRQAQSCLNPDSVIKEVTFVVPTVKRNVHSLDSSRIKSLLAHKSWEQAKDEDDGKPEGNNLSSTSVAGKARQKQNSSQFSIVDDSDVIWHPNMQIAYNFYEDHGIHNRKLEDGSKQKLVNKQIRSLQYNHHHWKSSVFDDPRNRDNSKDPRFSSCVNSWSIVRNPITGLQVKYNRV